MLRTVSGGARIELLWWEGCPSMAAALAELRAAVEERGIDPATVVTREISTDGQAAAEGFVGSPTIRIDGEDLFPPGREEPIGLTCRVYRLADGRISPTPDPGLLRDELERRLAG
jgi:hypothetical protein